MFNGLSLNNMVIGLGTVLSLVNFANSKPVLASLSSVSTGIMAVLNQTSKVKVRNLEDLLNESKKAEIATRYALEYAESQLSDVQKKLRAEVKTSIELKEKIETLESDLRSKNTKIRLLDESLSEGSKVNDSLRDEIIKLSQRLIESENKCEKFHNEIERLKSEIETYIKALNDANQTIESIRFDEYKLDEFRREQYELKSLQCEFEADKRVLDIELTRLSEQLAKAECEYETLKVKYDDDVRSAFNQGMEVKAEKNDHEIKTLRLEIERLQLQLNAKKALKAFNEKLGNIADKISTDYRPIVACGEPRSGKAQIVLQALKSLDNGSGIIPIIYDRSEGGKQGSTWDLAGLPSFSDFNLFMDCLRSVCVYAKRRPLIHQKESESIPPIFVIFDESRTALNGVDDEVIDEFVELFNTLKFELIKHKIILCVTSCSYQIQNMRAGKTQLFNGGDLENVHLFLLNQNIGKFYRDKCSKKSDIDEWLELSANQYICAYVETSSANLSISPIKHPTHHGNLRSNKKANSPITNFQLASIVHHANWLPSEFKILYNAQIKQRKSQDEVQNIAQSSNRTESLEPIRDNDPSVFAIPDEMGNCAKSKVWKIEDVDPDNIPIDLWNLLGEYKTQTKAILEVFGIKASGKNERYIKARNIYRKVKGKA